MDDIAQKNPPLCGFRAMLWMSLDGINWPFGAGSRNRTRDLLITNQLLYQLSYAGEEDEV
jgi:hypothetical protein